MGWFSFKKKKTYLDKNGYYRFIDSDRLVYRWVAQKYIYNENREEYLLPFSKYVIHHKDGNKVNNSVMNLKILTPDEHFSKHFPIFALIRKMVRWIFGMKK